MLYYAVCIIKLPRNNIYTYIIYECDENATL